MSWMCKKQTSVSHSSTEAELVSLDAGLHIDGILAFDLWDLAKEVFSLLSNPINENQKIKHEETQRPDTT